MAVGSGMAAGYAWTDSAPANLPATLPDIQKMQSGGLDGAIDSAVKGVLDATGLMDLLDKVTGNAQELHEAGQQWLSQARQVSDAASALRDGARTLEANWTGDASAAFGAFMGEVVGGLDDMAQDMAQTAEILNNAGQECQLAEDMITMIIRELIEWTLMTLATTVAMDIITLGLASVVGALAESAEVAAFVARAGEVSEKLAMALDKLMTFLRDAQKAARLGEDGAKLSRLKAAWQMSKSMRALGSGLKTGSNLQKIGTAFKEGRTAEALARLGALEAERQLKDGIKSGIGDGTGLPSEGIPKLFTGGAQSVSASDGVSTSTLLPPSLQTVLSEYQSLRSDRPAAHTTSAQSSSTSAEQREYLASLQAPH